MIPEAMCYLTISNNPPT